jgi:hypothetical protein
VCELQDLKFLFFAFFDSRKEPTGSKQNKKMQLYSGRAATTVLVALGG